MTRYRRHRLPAMWVGASILALLFAVLLLRVSTVESNPTTLPSTFPAFSADLTIQHGSTIEYASLKWQDRMNWRFDTYGSSERSTVIASQVVVDGVLSITRAGFSDETVIPERKNRAPGPWLVTSETATGRGAQRVGSDPVFTQLRDRLCGGTELAAICGGRPSIQEITRYEFDPISGILTRYTVTLDGVVVEDVHVIALRIEE